jgi:DNA repair exonuclease SbcCD nuclease subunit
MANSVRADVIITGDLFDVPRVTPEVVSIFVKAMLPLIGNVHIIGGNHSLPYHREAYVDQSSVGILKAMAGDNEGKIRYYTCVEESVDGRFEHSYKLSDDVTIVHTLTFPTEADIPFACNAATADYLFAKYDTPFIFIGDMHHDFVVRKDDRTIVNAGCMTVQSANEIGYDPCIYIVDTGEKADVSVMSDKKPVYRVRDSSIEKLLLPNDTSVLTRDHLTARIERDERIARAVASLAKDGERMTLSFIENLYRELHKQAVPPMVQDILDELKEEK